MPGYAVAIVLGSLLAFYGNELPDSSWSAFAPLLLLLCFFLPRYRFTVYDGKCILAESGERTSHTVTGHK